MKAVRIDNGILLYYGNRIGRVQGEHAHVDINFKNQRIIDFLKKQHVAEIEWTEGLYDRLLNTAADPEKEPKKIRIWQIRPEADVRIKFLSLDVFRKSFGNPDLGNYCCVYEGETEADNPEEIYLIYHMEQPEDYRGHPIAISDIIEQCGEEGSAYYYVDRYGLIQIQPDMEGEKMQQEMTL